MAAVVVASYLWNRLRLPFKQLYLSNELVVDCFGCHDQLFIGKKGSHAHCSKE
jgi:hypothetical protein